MARRKFSDEHRRKMSEAAIRRWKNPEYRKEMALIEMSDEAKKAMSERMKNQWKDPEYRQSRKKRELSEKARCSISEKTKARWADPEYKAQIAAKIGKMSKEIWERPGYKEKMSKALKGIQAGNKNSMWGKKYSDETRKKLSISHIGIQKGINHPMWGKHPSEESRKKMSESHVGIQKGENHPMWGKHQSEEAVKKMSESHKGVPLSEQHRKNIGLANIGKIGTWRGKSSPMKGRNQSNEARQKISKAHKGKRHSPETEFKKGMKHSKEYLEHMSQLMQEMWKDPNHVKKMAKALHVTPNKPETVVMNILNDLYPDKWKFTGDFTFTINGKCPDFVNVNGQKQIIEVWGDYWHNGENPQDRADVFKPYGYKTLVIWQHELKQRDLVIKKIQDFVRL